jgi:MYXO-CTERM domain-containing protein
MLFTQTLLAVFAATYVLLSGSNFVNAQEPNQTTVARDTRDDDDSDFGWIGLLGLVGLAGLLGRNREYGRDTVRTPGRVS